MRYRRDDSMDTWRGAVTERLESMDQAIRRLDQSMDAVKRELVDSNMKIARYVGAVGVLLALATILAPYLTKALFGGKP